MIHIGITTTEWAHEVWSEKHMSVFSTSLRGSLSSGEVQGTLRMNQASRAWDAILFKKCLK